MTIGLMIFLAKLARVEAADETIQEKSLTALYDSVDSIATKYFPEGTSHQFRNHIHFEHSTRLFIVPAIVKSLDDSQIPLEEVRGPQSGGVWCRIELREGKPPYSRAEGKVTRGEFDEYLFYPHSDRLDYHLYVTLRLPKNQSEVRRK
ncbi:MAG TPA: hypothetical protein VLA12_11850, partial [Planctomycetaceae bacterium]|nr:hypothetical protein [Planctomycetaceae bacterium]